MSIQIFGYEGIEMCPTCGDDIDFEDGGEIYGITYICDCGEIMDCSRHVDLEYI